MKISEDNTKTVKKHGAFFWLVWLVVSGMVLGFCMMILEVFVSFGMYDSETLFRKNCNEWLMRDYASCALSDFKGDFNLRLLRDTNFQYVVFSGSEPSEKEFKDPSAPLVCTIPEEYLKDGGFGLFRYSATLGDNSVFYYNIDSLWDSDSYVTNFYSEKKSDSQEDYYLYARVADPLNTEYDDLFVRSKSLIDMACSLRFLPILLAFAAGVFLVISFVKFIAGFFTIIRKVWKKLSYQWRGNVPLLFRLMGICAVATIAEFIVMVIALSGNADELIVLGWFCQTIVLVPLFIICCLQLNRVSKGAKALAQGNMSAPVDTSHMFFDLKEIGESINSAGAGLELAVNERMKSERFRTELISNVSHDIKTPLTSIISYVELLKEQPEGESANREYLEILEKQSVKLKKLLEDLIEASKAQTGNLKADLIPCNVNTVLHQVIGEYKEKLGEADLELNIRLPEEDINIMADTKHLQRVLDNLLVNVSKYAQPGTRVYVNLSGGSDEAAIEIKNTSKDPLNVTSDELLERFVRGDSSRNSEGNGLGLSIAQSLMELMNGKLKLSVDGDLFKVILLFPRIKQ